MPSYRLPGLPEDDPGRRRLLPWVEMRPHALGSSRRGPGNRSFRSPSGAPGVCPSERVRALLTVSLLAPRHRLLHQCQDAVGHEAGRPHHGAITGDFAHFHHPRRTAVSTLRPALLATTSYVRVVSPASTTISTRSPFTVSIPLLRRPLEITQHGAGRGLPRFRPTSPGSQAPLTIDRPTHARPLSARGRQSVSCARQTDSDGQQRRTDGRSAANGKQTAADGAPHQGLREGLRTGGRGRTWR